MRNDDRDQFSRTELDGKNAKKKISTSSKMVIFVIGVFFVAYFIQFVWFAMDSKGQYQDDYAWEVLAHETLSRQYQGVPEMRVTYGKPTHRFCDFWSFEAIWGNCLTVKIGLDVRDYRPEYKSTVEREVARLIGQLSKPCKLLSTLALEHESDLAKIIGCNSRRKFFKLHIWVNEVTVGGERGPVDRPNRWSINTAKHLYTTDFFEGAF
ncbi:hypothetical protein [Azonexus hydrophilus]|uniref:Uncharacterized protein n=1 Tax=Azonexus hydrophilus TaxID=418702 RepID=A0ABZ2XDJ9_9RHOO|nr:hypothetical protein [Azonexus hydrophilus]